MANQIFDGNTNYVERFTKNQSKRIKFPTFKYLDAKLHPRYKDHIVVLSSNEFPENVKMTYAFESPPFYSLDTLDSMPETSTFFTEAVDEVEERRRQKELEALDKKHAELQKIKPTKFNQSPMLNSANALLEETKELGLDLDSESDNDSYEGGESDEEENKKDKDKNSNQKAKKKKKNKKQEKKRLDSEDLEQEMDSILKEEAKKEEDEMVVEASMEETMVKLMEDEGLGTQRSNKKKKEELKRDGEATEDKDSEADILDKSSKGSVKGKKTLELSLDEEVKEPAKGKSAKDEVSKSKDFHATEDEQSNAEHRDEKLTSVPKEDENRSNKTQEDQKDEEEEDKAQKESEEVKVLTPTEKFDKFTEEEKQMVVDITLDKFFETNVKMKFGYHGYCINKDVKQNFV